jgi:hypothetical protein
VKYLTINPTPSIGRGPVKATLEDYRGTAEGKTNVISARSRSRAADIRYSSLEQEQEGRGAHCRAYLSRGTWPLLPAATLRFGRRGLPADGADGPGNEALSAGAGTARAADPLGPRGPAGARPGRAGCGRHRLHCPPAAGPRRTRQRRRGNSHAPGEYTDLSTLTPMSQRAAVLIYRLTR